MDLVPVSQFCSISMVVIIIGNLVYYADVGHIDIFSRIFLLMSGDPAVLNHGDKSVGQC